MEIALRAFVVTACAAASRSAGTERQVATGFPFDERSHSSRIVARMDEVCIVFIVFLF